MKKRYLILEDGTIFQGWAFGADKATIGELVFHTGVVGYVENLTDPRYYGQILMQTFPAVGNYGIMESDFEGKPLLNGQGILSRHFETVQRLDREDGLAITDIHDFADYIYSLSSLTDIQSLPRHVLLRKLAERVENGILYVPKEYGMFACR